MTAYAWDSYGGRDLGETLRKVATDLGLGGLVGGERTAGERPDGERAGDGRDRGPCGSARFDQAAQDTDGAGRPGRGPGGFGGFGGFAGFPFGPPPGGPRGPRGGRGPWGKWGGWDAGPGSKGRAGRGDVRSAILALLTEQPMHGYQLIQEIGRRSNGAWKPSPGSVYPTLQQLEDEGLVRAEELDGKRVFRLTADGEQLAADRAEEFAHLWDGFAVDEDDSQIGELVFGVASAFAHLMRTGTPEQVDQARKVLARTRADLYKILGDASAAPAAAGSAATTDDTTIDDPEETEQP